MIIDIAAHIVPRRYFENISGMRGSYMEKRVARHPTLHDLDIRFRIMDRFSAFDYRQLLTLALPAIETVDHSRHRTGHLPRAQRGAPGAGSQVSRPLRRRPRLPAIEQP